jgi:hypothetical protein
MKRFKGKIQISPLFRQGAYLIVSITNQVPASDHCKFGILEF